MTQLIKLELPLDPSILRANARMLDTIADGLCGPMLPGIHEEMPSIETAVAAGVIGQPEVIPSPTPEVDTVPTPESTVPAPEATIPTPTVDAIPTPETEAPAPEVDVDNRGLVWDKRIHASSKAKNVDGTWRNKRGVDKTLLAQVEAELLGTADEKPATPPPETQPEAPAPTAPTVETPAPTAPTETVAITTFGELMAAITKAGITPEQTQAACVKAGVASVALLAARADLVPTVASDLGL